ncbi:MAG: HRDC domain-containing protein [Nocardioidaceae bacterium]
MDEEPPEAPPALELREPLPPVVDTDTGLSAVVEAVAHGDGPVALDAERASGYRYSARAYLVQLRRHRAGTALIDPIAFDDLTVLDAAIKDAEWILHAATQDLPCLADIGLTPRRLFDTELAGRLLNLPRVGLAYLVQEVLGHSLAKEHSAVDWSTRPLPEPWLLYAALDVEVLVELRDDLESRLVEAGKREWAQQEFDALLSFTGPRRRAEPWRRTSGIHKARNRRSLGLVRALWERRDELAAGRDVTPGRILPDAAIIEIATSRPKDRSTLRDLPTMRKRGARRYIEQWYDAVQAALALAEDELPGIGQRYDGPPPARAWAERNPEAAARLGRCREALTAMAEANDLPVENLLTPDTVRRLAWDPPAEASQEAVAEVLRGHGARPWQVELSGPPLAEALDTV